MLMFALSASTGALMRASSSAFLLCSLRAWSIWDCCPDGGTRVSPWPYDLLMTSVNPDLEYLLSSIDDDVLETLAAPLEVQEKHVNTFTADQIRSSLSNVWMKLPEVVAVAFDMVGSTKLGLKHHDSSAARIYQSGVGGAVKSLSTYGADFIDIQGDGGFGLYWGEKAHERALCAAITIKTFSLKFVERLIAKYGDGLPDTGFKVGMHADRTLVKKIGTLRKPDEQEPVWAGRSVNYSYKCAQAADAHQLIITDKVWQKFKNNDFVVYSCGCSEGVEPSNNMWQSAEHEVLPEGKNLVHILDSSWCVNCGPGFAEAIMKGKKNRDDIEEWLRDQQRQKMAAALEATRKIGRKDRIAHNRGMSGR